MNPIQSQFKSKSTSKSRPNLQPAYLCQFRAVGLLTDQQESTEVQSSTNWLNVVNWGLRWGPAMLAIGVYPSHCCGQKNGLQQLPLPVCIVQATALLTCLAHSRCCEREHHMLPQARFRDAAEPADG